MNNESNGTIPEDRLLAVEEAKKKLEKLKGKARRLEMKKVALDAVSDAPVFTREKQQKLKDIKKVKEPDARPVAKAALKEVRSTLLKNPNAEPNGEFNRRDKVLAMAAAGYNNAEIGRALHISETYVSTLITHANSFEELREREARYYILRTWRSLHHISDALDKKINSSDLTKESLRTLTGALYDLKRSLDNAVSFVQVNVQKNEHIPTDDMIFEYVKSNPRLLNRILEWEKANE